jgi:hypothetical protein
VEIELAGETILTLSPADCLVYLSFHGAWHMWDNLHWVEDIAGLIDRAPGLDWEQVASEAQRLGMRRRLLLALKLASELLGAKVPGAILRLFGRDRRLSTCLGQVMRLLFVKERSCLFTEKHYFNVAMMEHFRDRVRYLRSIIGTPNARDAEFLAVPKKFGFLYYLARPVRQAKKFLPVLLSDLREMKNHIP